MVTMFRFVLIGVAVVGFAGCGDDRFAMPAAGDTPDAGSDAPTDAPIDAPVPLPTRLIDTGLCVDPACSQIAADVRTYVPRWQLWTDGAAKQRWIRMPSRTKIDNSDPDHWQFPIGTQIWKVFSLAGTRVETRYMVKLGPGEDQWSMVSYAWNSAQSEAVAVPAGLENANGTSHDIPSRNECRQCHERIAGRVLGLSALALDYRAPVDTLDLDTMAAIDWLTTALPGTVSPHYPLPMGRSAAETENAAEALGYMHINCGHCHNPQSPVYNSTALELRLTTGALATWPSTVVYTTAIGVTGSDIDGATVLVKPQDPDGSILFRRLVSPNLSVRMPALGTVQVDAAAATRIRSWINSLPVE
jgi:hypothetical protein